MAKLVKERFDKRKHRVRVSIKSKADGKPRLSVFRSGKHMYAQVVDDSKGNTIVSASTLDQELKKKLQKTSNMEAAEMVGGLVAEKALKAGVSGVVFDRGGYLYHGRVKALADAARAKGLIF